MIYNFTQLYCRIKLIHWTRTADPHDQPWLAAVIWQKLCALDRLVLLVIELEFIITVGTSTRSTYLMYIITVNYG